MKISHVICTEKLFTFTKVATFYKYTNNEYEDQYQENHIPMELKLAIVQYSQRIIGCEMLTIREDADFYEIL